MNCPRCHERIDYLDCEADEHLVMYYTAGGGYQTRTGEFKPSSMRYYCPSCRALLARCEARADALLGGDDQ